MTQTVLACFISIRARWTGYAMSEVRLHLLILALLPWVAGWAGYAFAFSGLLWWWESVWSDVQEQKLLMVRAVQHKIVFDPCVVLGQLFFRPCFIGNWFFWCWFYFTQLLQRVTVLAAVWLTCTSFELSSTDGLAAWYPKQRQEQSEASVWPHRKAGEPAEFGVTNRVGASGGEWHLQHWHHWNIYLQQEVRMMEPAPCLYFTEIICPFQEVSIWL